VTETPSFEGYRFFGIGKLQTIPDGWRILKTIAYEWWQSRTTRQAELYLGFRGLQPANADWPATRALQANGANTLDAVYQLTQMIAAEPDPQARLARMLEHMLTYLGAKSGSVLLLDEAGQVSHGLVAYAGEMHAPTAREVHDLFQSGLAGWVVEHRQPALLPSTLDDPRWLRRAWEQPGDPSRSAVSVPLSLFERTIGVITLVTEPGAQFSQTDLALLTTVALGLSLSAAGFMLPLPETAEFAGAPDPRQERGRFQFGV